MLIISPVRDEEAYIEIVARSMAAQTRPPDLWVVVDDGSVDGTVERLCALAADLPFMRVLTKPRAPASRPVKDRLADGSCMKAFNWALEQAGWEQFDYIGKLDGDIELPPRYFEQLVPRLDQNPSLGIASGSLSELGRAGWRRIPVPEHNVPGSLKLYRRPCLAAIAPLPGSLGWDTTDETYARMRGFSTRSFRDIVVRHHRPGATRDGLLRGRARYGTCAYINHYSPAWTILRTLKVATQKPVVLSGVAFLYGYVRAALSATPQVPDDEFRVFVRREHRRRILGSVRLIHRARAHATAPAVASAERR